MPDRKATYVSSPCSGNILAIFPLQVPYIELASICNIPATAVLRDEVGHLQSALQGTGCLPRKPRGENESQAHLIAKSIQIILFVNVHECSTETRDTGLGLFLLKPELIFRMMLFIFTFHPSTQQNDQNSSFQTACFSYGPGVLWLRPSCGQTFGAHGEVRDPQMGTMTVCGRRQWIAARDPIEDTPKEPRKADEMIRPIVQKWYHSNETY